MRKEQQAQCACEFSHFADLQEVRLNLGKYMSRLGAGQDAAGVHLLLGEMVGNAVDESARGYGKVV